jgi:hypothetical protein
MILYFGHIFEPGMIKINMAGRKPGHPAENQERKS